jgi:hypothetical protein
MKDLKTEEYVVRFWIKKEDGFFEQRKESVWYSSKNKSHQAAQEILKKYSGKIKIISVVYQ